MQPALLGVYDSDPGSILEPCAPPRQTATSDTPRESCVFQGVGTAKQHRFRAIMLKPRDHGNRDASPTGVLNPLIKAPALLFHYGAFRPLWQQPGLFQVGPS